MPSIDPISETPALRLKKNVAIVDDHAVFRIGLRQCIDAQPDLNVVCEGANGHDALGLAKAMPLDAMVLDLSMPGMSGIDIISTLHREVPKLAILVVSGYAQERYGMKLIQLGAKGYLSKDSEADILVEAVRRIAGGKGYITPAISQQFVANLVDRDVSLQGKLSLREYQVMLKLASGLTLQRTAEALCLSPKTVSLHRMRLMEKLHLSSNTDLTYFALKHDLLRFDLPFR